MSVFTLAEQRLFKNMSADERKQEVRTIMKERRRRLKVLSQGKNFLDLNIRRLWECRREEQAEKFYRKSVLNLSKCRKLMMK
jgi:hypothetical protein